ncbi:MAG: hypothetical protein ACE5G0_20045 [Rhodothermales bacterium]
MRKTLSLLFLVAFLGMAVPAQAQLRSGVHEQRASSRLYDAGGPGFLLNKLFNPAVFKMSHSLEMSFGSFGGNRSSLGMYTNTLAWQFSDKLAARVDLSVAYSPFNSGDLGMGEQKPRVFLRNAEVAYRPSKNVEFHLQVRQSPYGSYASPYGFYNPYGFQRPYRSSYLNVGYGRTLDDLFWRDGR